MTLGPVKLRVQPVLALAQLANDDLQFCRDRAHPRDFRLRANHVLVIRPTNSATNAFYPYPNSILSILCYRLPECGS